MTNTQKVRVWHVSTAAIASDRTRLDRLVEWLQPPERARYERFLHDDDRRMFLLGRVMARTVVGQALGCEPRSWRWREGPHGRPEIDAPDAMLRFNIAHSAGVVVCALAEGREVGVDIEDLERRPVDRAFVTRYCAPAEVADVFAQADDAWHDRFLTYWTLKESYLKARGLGVSVTLSHVCFSLDRNGVARVNFLEALAGTDTRWTFELSRLTPRHLVAVAASSADGAECSVCTEPFDLAAVLNAIPPAAGDR